jgi:hypothetical protein
MPRRSKRNLIAEGEADYQKWRAGILADPTRRSRYDEELAKQLAYLELRIYTKEQIEQFIKDDKLSPEQQRIADEFAKLPSKETRKPGRFTVELRMCSSWRECGVTSIGRRLKKNWIASAPRVN